MNCPVCPDSTLVRTTHGGFNLFQCESCYGHLVESRRMESLQKRINKDPKELAEIISRESKSSTNEPIRCPRCRNRMDKSLSKTKPEFEIDSCRNCDFNWLDGGELAKYELDFEFHVQQIELEEMRTRLDNMSPTERAEFQAAVDAMPGIGEPFTEGVKKGAVDLAMYVAFRSLLNRGF